MNDDEDEQAPPGAEPDPAAPPDAEAAAPDAGDAEDAVPGVGAVAAGADAAGAGAEPIAAEDGDDGPGVARAGGITTSPPSPDIDLGSEAATLPGEHRGGFTRPPTAPVEVSTTQSIPAEDLSEELIEVRWAPHSLEPSGPQRGIGAWALSFAVAGLAVSFFVGWGLPLGIVAIILSIVALRRPVESRTVSGWALALGVLSVLYSAGWILWAIGHPVL